MIFFPLKSLKSGIIEALTPLSKNQHQKEDSANLTHVISDCVTHLTSVLFFWISLVNILMPLTHAPNGGASEKF